MKAVRTPGLFRDIAPDQLVANSCLRALSEGSPWEAAAIRINSHCNRRLPRRAASQADDQEMERKERNVARLQSLRPLRAELQPRLPRAVASEDALGQRCKTGAAVTFSVGG